MGMITRQRRITILLLLFFACSIFLILKLFSLQILQAHNLTAGSVNQRMVAYQLDSGRGDILDREGASLTGFHREVLIAFPFLITDINQVREELGSVFNRDELKIIETKIRNTSDKKAVLIAPTKELKLSQEHIKKIEGKEIPGIVLAQEKERYNTDPLAAHLIGFITSITSGDLQIMKEEGYSINDKVGAMGIERMFEKELRAAGPEMLSVFLDGKDRVLPGLGYRHIPSEKNMAPLNVKLTIDSSVQRIVEEKMDRYIQNGAVVVMDPKNGDILAMASRYQLNQSDPTKKGSSELNRTLLNYNPASVFKVVVAAAALEKGYFTMNDRFTCSGQIEAGSNIVNCHHGPHGEITLGEALAHSCNTAFVEIGLEIGGESIIEYAQKMGLGKRTGLYPYPHEDRESRFGKLPLYEELLSPAGISNAVLGHKQVKATPLQIARMFAAIANDGKMVSPRIVMELTTSRGVTVQRFPQDRGRMVLLPSTAKQLKQMLTGVSRFGTGQAASVKGYVTAGKTGTVQAENKENPSWFAGFTPVEYPVAVVVVFIEERMRQGYNADFVYSEIIEEILEKKR